jgi:Bacterial aa3 type cytochrome c oxidase subunit IV
MAASTMDPLYSEHYRTWLGFTRLIRYALVLIVILLAGMGYFLT